MVSCPLLFPPVNTGSPLPPKAANVHAYIERKAASSGEPLDRRKVCRLLTVKKRKGFLLFLEQKTKAEGKISAFLCNNYLTKHRKT